MFFPSDRRPPPPGRFIHAHGMRLHVEQRGTTGPGLLLLHGYLASTAIWHTVLARLGCACRAVALDLPGAGYSDRPKDAPYDLPWFADLLPVILDALDLDQPVLCGHSLGGAVALHAADRHKGLLSGLVLVSPLVYTPPPPPGLRLAKIFPGPARLFFSSPAGRALVAFLVRRAVYADDHDRALVRAGRMLAHLDAPGGWEAATRTGLQAHDHSPGPDLLSRIDLPCLVFWGGRDRAHPCELGPRLVRDLAGPARMILLRHAAHNCHEEQSDRFCDEVLSWMDLR